MSAKPKATKDTLPDYSDFVWVWREQNSEPELAYYNQSSKEFQDAYSVGDQEGLSIEIYHDVRYWAELVPPLDVTPKP